MSSLGRLEEAIELYRRRAGMGGWPEEVFYALYQLGLLNDRLGRRDQAMMALFDAWNSCPQRAEPLYVLSWMFRERRQYHTAHMLSERGMHTPVPADALFLHRWMYEWGLLFEYSIAAYWVGQPDAALRACDRLLAMPHLPDAYREQTEVNRRYCLRSAQGSASRASSATSSLPWSGVTANRERRA
jgi:hypothetical protein